MPIFCGPPLKVFELEILFALWGSHPCQGRRKYSEPAPFGSAFKQEVDSAIFRLSFVAPADVALVD